MQKTLGGDRLGSGKKQKVYLHNYERSTHDLSYVWRSTMAAGTLVPFLVELALPGDTFDINLSNDVKTHPTIGPLFGSYKVQLDLFLAPIRLYNSLLHNNALGIGLDMSQVKLPQIELTAIPITTTVPTDLDNFQINPSCLLSYLGIRGVGIKTTAGNVTRNFNAVPLFAYWDIYKNYYANKQEEIGAVLHTPAIALVQTVTAIVANMPDLTTITIDQFPLSTPEDITESTSINIQFTGATPIPSQIMFDTEAGFINGDQLGTGWTVTSAGNLVGTIRSTPGIGIVYNWRYQSNFTPGTVPPIVTTFPLSNIDDMRNAILAFNSKTTPFVTPDTETITPYSWLSEISNGVPNMVSSQEGLGLKTYQSDLLNNWLKTEWIDGAGGISEVTAIDTSGGSFTIDTLNLSKKVYDMLNRIAVSGGTYDDWLDAVYTHDRYIRCESPMYMGGLIKELVFQEVVSNSESGGQPLGTLAGKGVMDKKHKGGNVTIKVDEPSYIMGIISLTPRIDYSQGNKWDTNLQTLNDLHKPALDEIGFQDLITEQMAWWDTHWNGTTWVQLSAGKQPAWTNYMTNLNQTRGNFASETNEMFMTLNRRYEPTTGYQIDDVTTYIDPSKFNFIFAQTSLDAQNFWVQIGVGITARRKMSAKVMPNL